MEPKVKITVSGLYNYSVNLTEKNALSFLKDLKKKHINKPVIKPLSITIQKIAP